MVGGVVVVVCEGWDGMGIWVRQGKAREERCEEGRELRREWKV